MKKLATIIMLVAALLCCAPSISSKTTKRTSKTKTTQTASNALWNGDLPTGKNICSLMNKSWSDLGYFEKGYRTFDDGPSYGIKKNGVCTIFIWGGSGGGGYVIQVDNVSKLNWLYQDIKKANAKSKTYNSIDLFKEEKEIWVGQVK